MIARVDAGDGQEASMALPRVRSRYDLTSTFGQRARDDIITHGQSALVSAFVVLVVNLGGHDALSCYLPKEPVS